MAKKKKKKVEVTNPFETGLENKIKDTFTVDPNAKAPKMMETFPGSIVTGIKTIFNLPAMAIEAANRAQLNLTGNGDQPTKPLYKFTNKNIINGMQGLSAPYRRFIAEPTVTKLIMAQQMFRNPSKYWNNPTAIYELAGQAYARAQGDRTGLQWYEDPKGPVTMGQAIDAVLRNPLDSSEVPSLLDVDAVNQYYVYDRRSEYMDLVNPTPGKTASGALDFAAVMFFDPVNYLPGPKGVSALTKGAKSATEVATWSGQGLKQLTPENFREIAVNAYNTGREDIGEFALLLEEMGTEGAGKLIDNYVFYGTPEFEQTASIIKSTFEDYKVLEQRLPGEQIPEVPGDVKYFVSDGDAWAASDSSIFQWTRPYINSRGQEVEGYWRESALFPRSIIDESQANAVEPFQEVVTQLIKDGEVEPSFNVPSKNIKVAEGIKFDNPYLGSAFENSLVAVRPDLSPGGSTIPSNAFELPTFDLATNKISRIPLKSQGVDFAVFYMGGKRTVAALDRKTGTIYTLDSYRPTITRKADTASQDVLVRAEQLADEVTPVDSRQFQNIIEQLIAASKDPNLTSTREVVDKAIKDNNLSKSFKAYKETISDRYVAGQMSQEEIDALAKYGESFDAAQVSKKSKFGYSLFEEAEETGSISGRADDDYVEEFFALFNEENVYDDVDDFGIESVFPETMSELPDLNLSKTFSGNRQLVWVKQAGFDLSGVDGYEMAFYSPFDGNVMTGIVPSNFVIIVPPSTGVEGVAKLPQLKKIESGNIVSDEIYSFDISGTLTTLAEAKSSFARLKETLIRTQLEMADIQRSAIKTISNVIEQGDVGIANSIKSLTKELESLKPKVANKQAEIKALKERVRKLEDLTPEEENLLRISNVVNSMQERLDNLLYSQTVINNITDTPQEIGFWFRITNTQKGVEVNLVRRKLDWDSYGESKALTKEPVDEIVGTWKLTNSQLKQVNFKSVTQYDGYSTDWDLFKKSNLGDDGIYTINAKELDDWGTRKAFRLRDYRRKLNELRKARGQQTIQYAEGSTVNYKEFRLEQLRADYIKVHKQKVWAEQRLGRKNLSEKDRTYTKGFLDEANRKLEQIKLDAARDEELIDSIIASGGSLNVDITPAMWQAIYGQPPKMELYLNGFLKALNEIGGTSVALKSPATASIFYGNPYPMADEWADTPMAMNVVDTPVPEEVLEQVETPGIAQVAEPQPIPVASASFDPASPVVIHSGGARGADSTFAQIADELGIETKAHSFKGHKLANAGKVKKEIRIEHSPEELSEADELLEKVNTNYLEREIPSDLFVKNLLRRNYFQVKNSDAVIAISSFDKNFTVKGGTGWAVGMGVELGKPVYVFNLDNNRWYKIVDNFEGITINGLPPKFNSFAGIGTREITEKGKQAIKEYLEQYRGNQ